MSGPVRWSEEQSEQTVIKAVYLCYYWSSSARFDRKSKELDGWDKKQCKKRDSRWSIRRPTLDQQKEIWKIQKNYRQWANHCWKQSHSLDDSGGPHFRSDLLLVGLNVDSWKNKNLKCSPWQTLLCRHRNSGFSLKRLTGSRVRTKPFISLLSLIPYHLARVLRERNFGWNCLPLPSSPKKVPMD